MPHPLSRHEANALHFHALALRPDWANNNPGGTWKQTLDEKLTLPHAENYPHALEALTEYATATKDGKPVKRTPNLYPSEGAHWTTTQPKAPEGTASTPCEDHPTFDGHNCRCCLADVKTGFRPRDMIGLRLVTTDDEQSPVS